MKADRRVHKNKDRPHFADVSYFRSSLLQCKKTDSAMIFLDAFHIDSVGLQRLSRYERKILGKRADSPMNWGYFITWNPCFALPAHGRGTGTQDLQSGNKIKTSAKMTYFLRCNLSTFMRMIIIHDSQTSDYFKNKFYFSPFLLFCTCAGCV